MAGDDLGWLGGALGGLGSIIGAGINSATQSKINKENIAMQKEFAQNGIQWKVQDAQKAGIHPAVALGAQTYQATPSSVAPDVGSGVAGAFKHFGSAIDSFIEDKSEERQLQLESAKLDNEAKRLEIAKMKNASNNSINPSINNNSLVPTSAVDGTPNDVPKNGKLWGQDKVIDDFNLVRTKDGSVSVVPSDGVSEYVSESVPGSVSWHYRNYTPDLDSNIYSDFHNRLVASGQMNPLSEGLIHNWSPVLGNTWKIVSKNSDEWKEWEKTEKYSPLGLVKSIYNQPKDLVDRKPYGKYYKRYNPLFAR